MRANCPPTPVPAAVYQPLVVLAAALAAGIAADRFGSGAGWPMSATSWWLAAALALAAWCGLHCRRRGAWSVPFSAAVLCGGVCAAGAAWHHASWNLFRSDEIGRYAGPRAALTCVEAVALQSPHLLPPPSPSPYRAIPAGERSQLRIAVLGIRRGTDWQPARGEARLSVNGRLSGVQAGDRLRIFAHVASPRVPQNPGEFHFANHARAERRLAELRSSFPECVQVVQAGTWFAPRRILDRAQRWCVERLHDRLGPHNGPVAAAFLLGVREGIAPEELQAYQATGTIHLLVVSGLHVGILAAGAFVLFRWIFLTRSRALLATALVVVFFALLTGGRPSVIRATVGTLSVLAALAAGRRVSSWNILAGAAVLVLILSPPELFRAGPQLSFLAVATLIWYARTRVRRRRADSPLDRMKRAARPLPVQWGYALSRWTCHLVAATACLWLAALPLVTSQFHVAAPIGVLLAPLVLLIAWVGLTSGLAMLAVEAVLPIASGPLMHVCRFSIEVLRGAVAYAEATPWGHFSVAGPAAWWMAGAYGGLLAAVLVGGRLPSRWKLAALALWIAVGVGASGMRRADTEALQCTFLSVGHGTCIVLELPDGKTIVYDVGSLVSPERAASSLAGYLWSEGINHLDGLILSHADLDHFNGVPRLLQRFSVASVLVSPVMFDPWIHRDEASAPRRLQQELLARNVPIQEIYSGDRPSLGGGVVAEVLHPPRDGVFGSDNANSIVLALEFAGRRVLLTGDLESPGMEDLLAELPYDVDVLLAPHHGSRFSDPPGLADWCKPEWVVISGGEAGAAAVAEETYRRKGARVLHTAELGAVRFRLDRAGLTVQHWAENSWAPLPKDESR